MVKNCYVFFILVVLAVTVYIAETRPQFKESLEAISKVTEGINDSAITFIKQLTGEALKDDKNKTKTRILFRGDLLGGEFGDQDIIFPDTYQVIFNDVPKIDGPPKCAEGNTFCEDFDSYPYNHVKNVLKRKRVHTDLFGKDELLDERYSITNRNGDFEAFICTSISKTIFPRVGINKNNKWKVIINQEEDGYIQGIRTEICRKEGAACDLIGDRANGYITSCKQKYMLRRMMSLSENGDPVPDTFQLPSACCCSYRKDLSFLSRFGADDVSLRSKGKGK
ncbi:protein spaetzle [Tribolium castaneum]|uniref:protein spaetzle n=1 Tax=Tribolium castaneum TaxID=7070 RepID=UPI0030FE4315